MHDERERVLTAIRSADNPLVALENESRRLFDVLGDDGPSVATEAFHTVDISRHLLDSEPDPSRRFYFKSAFIPRMLEFLVSNISGERGKTLRSAVELCKEGEYSLALEILNEKPSRADEASDFMKKLDEQAESALRILVRAGAEGVHPYHLNEALCLEKKDRIRMMDLGIEAARSYTTREFNSLFSEAYKSGAVDIDYAGKMFFVGVISYLHEQRRMIPDAIFDLKSLIPAEVYEKASEYGTPTCRKLIYELNQHCDENPELILELTPRKLLEEADDLDMNFLQVDFIDRLADYFGTYCRESYEVDRLLNARELDMCEYWFGEYGQGLPPPGESWELKNKTIVNRLCDVDWRSVDLSTIGVFGGWMEEVGLDRRLAVLVAQAFLDD